MKKIIYVILALLSLGVSNAFAYDMYYVNGSDNRLYVRDSADTTGGGSARTASQVVSQFGFSPDGAYIIYSRGTSSPRCYRRTLSDTSTSQDGIAMTTQTCIEPTYSPDGNYIVYV